MNKTQLVEAVAAEANLSKKDAEAAVKATFAAIEGALVKGDKVQLIGFGTFETRVRGERTGKNPRTGETVKIAACKAPAFKAGKALKDIVNPSSDPQKDAHGLFGSCAYFARCPKIIEYF